MVFFCPRCSAIYLIKAANKASLVQDASALPIPRSAWIPFSERVMQPVPAEAPSRSVASDATDDAPLAAAFKQPPATFAESFDGIAMPSTPVDPEFAQERTPVSSPGSVLLLADEERDGVSPTAGDIQPAGGTRRVAGTAATRSSAKPTVAARDIQNYQAASLIPKSTSRPRRLNVAARAAIALVGGGVMASFLLGLAILFTFVIPRFMPLAASPGAWLDAWFAAQGGSRIAKENIGSRVLRISSLSFMPTGQMTGGVLQGIVIAEGELEGAAEGQSLPELALIRADGRVVKREMITPGVRVDRGSLAMAVAVAPELISDSLVKTKEGRGPQPFSALFFGVPEGNYYARLAVEPTAPRGQR